MRLRIASRGSQLALWQANHVGGLLEKLGHSFEVVVIKTTGDKMQSVSFAQVGMKGMFTKEIEEALAEGEADLAVHSMKDVPTELMPAFGLAATLERDDPRDAFLSMRYESVEELPMHARVGTSSLRREAQLKLRRPGLRISSLRGNVDTRIRKLESGEYDAILLAAAGVKRLGLERWVKRVMPASEMIPAVGQGALAVEILRNAVEVRNVVRLLNHSETEMAVRSERTLLRALGGGCQVPIAAYAHWLSGSMLQLQALVARPDGSEVLSYSEQGSSPELLGEGVARELLRMGAERLLSDLDGRSTAVPDQP